MEKRGVIDQHTPNPGTQPDQNQPLTKQALDRIEDDPMTRLARTAQDEAKARREHDVR